MEFIKVKNAYLHNLKHVNVEIPKNKFVVVTGVSGSGKTSLISDIIDEVGCCEYLESLGLPQQTSIHDYYESITGLNPTISVKSSNEGRWNSRSTVGTKTGILNYLRLLYLTEGEIECLSCGKKNRLGGNRCSCGEEIPSVESRQLSFNSSAGKCEKCNGMGYVVDVDFDIFRKNNHMTLPDLCTLIRECKPLKKQLSFFAEALHVDLTQPLSKQPALVVDAFLNGMQSQKSNFRGIGPYLVKLYSEDKYSGTLLHKCICPECKGDRLNKLGRSIKIETISLPEASQFSINRLQDFIDKLMERSTTTELGKNIGKLLIDQLNDLIRIGLGYLNLYRTIPSLSGGEYQRLKLAALLQSTMEDIVVIADEPLTGLHPMEKIQVLNQMRLLCEKGNTVIIIEHNIEAMERADYIIDFGPFGGKRGGNILYEGSFRGLLVCDKSITAQYINEISEKSELPMIQGNKTNQLPIKNELLIKNANANNLRNIDVSIPLHKLVGIAGVSGSGKSSLIAKTLVPLLEKCFSVPENEEKAFLNELVEDTCHGASLDGACHITGYVYVSQYPIGRNNRSTVATYVGLMKHVQAIFAKQDQAKEYNYKSKDFSFNSTGACKFCGGTGSIQTAISEEVFMESKCLECNGTRYDEKILKIKYKGRNIAEIMETTIAEAKDFFVSEKKIQSILCELESLGLGYLTLGQPTPSLSGGEAQRIKLLKSLLENKENMLYLLDEPTIGLGLYDIYNLNTILKRLIDKGHSVIVIEHDVVVLSNCHWIIEIGPGPDSFGGEVNAEGTPYVLKNNKKSKIGKYILKQ